MRKMWSALLLVVLFQAAAGAPWQRVISHGADLSPEDRVSVVRDFDLPPEVNPGQIPTVTVEHREEIDLLQQVAPAEEIGIRAVTSVYIEAQAQDSGIQVGTKNIDWVTPEMYANAMVTAGIRDIKAVVVAPSPAPGAPALAGIFKAYSRQSGREIAPAAREAAVHELVGASELGRSLGGDKAARFMTSVKEEVLSSKAATYNEIRGIVERVAGERNIELTDEQLGSVTNTMLRLSRLGLDPDQLRAQLKNFAQEAPETPGGISGLLARLLDFLQSLFQRLLGFVGRMLR